MSNGTLTALEIAETAVNLHNLNAFQKSADPLRLDDTTRVWCAIYMDMDYEQAFLFRTYSTTKAAPDGRTLELVDHLAVWDHHGGPADGERKLDVEWFNDPRLFFETTSEWIAAASHYFIDWVVGLRDAKAKSWNRDNPESAAMTEKHNTKVEEADRARARALGLNLPYLDIPEGGG